jgi:hypothetical protein
MRLRKPVLGVFVLFGLLLLLAGTVLGQYDQEMVIVFTTDTSGELNPCG